MNGILIINKPKGYTSFDIISILRKKLGQRKIGHMGTLDPMATGVLPVLLGEAAKFQIYCKENDKQYTVNMHLGTTTDTLDITGKIISNTESKIKLEEFKKILNNFKGDILQIPPMFSAIKIGGQKLCNLARKGLEIKREARKIKIKKINILCFDEKNQNITLEVLCSKGTYIRSLCSDIGKELGCGAVMTALERTLSNGFTISQSVSLEKIEELSADDIINNYVLPTDTLFKNLNKTVVSDAQAKRFQNGGNLSLQRLPHSLNFKDTEIIKVYTTQTFVGLGKIDKGKNELKILKCQINT